MKKLLTIILLLGLVSGANASQVLVEAPFFTMDDDGTLCNACVIHTYECGTTTNKATYTTAALSVAQANPVVLGSDGRSADPIYFSGCIKYVLKDSASGNTIDTIDNYYGQGATPPTGVALSSYTNVADFITTAGSTVTILWVDEDTTLTAAATFNANTTIIGINGNTITDAGYNVVVNGSCHASEGMFTGTGDYTFAGPLYAAEDMVTTTGSVTVTDVLLAGRYRIKAGTGTLNLQGAKVDRLFVDWYGALGDGDGAGDASDDSTSNSTSTGTDDATYLQHALNDWEVLGGPLEFNGNKIYRCDSALAMQLDGSGTEGIDFVLNGNGAQIDCSHHTTAGEACLTLGATSTGNFEDEGSIVVNNLYLHGCEYSDVRTNTTTETTEGLYLLYAGDVSLNNVRTEMFYRGIHTQYTFPLIANYVNVMRNGIGLLLDESSNLQQWHQIDAARCRYSLVISGDISEGDDSGKINDVLIKQFHAENSLVGVVIDPGSDNSNVTIRGIKFDTVYMASVTYDFFRLGLDFVYATPQTRTTAATRLCYDISIDGSGILNPNNGMFTGAAAGDNGQAIVVFGESTGNPRIRQFWGKFPADWENRYSGQHDGAGDAAVMTDSGASFRADRFIGETVYNRTDGSSCTVTDNDGTTITCTLAGGTDDDWDEDDEYEIAIPGFVGDPKGGILFTSGYPDGSDDQFWTERRWENDGEIYYSTAVETAIGTCTISAHGRTMLNSTNAAVTATLGAGAWIGQIKEIGMTNASNDSTVSVTNHATSDPEVFTFNATDDWLVLQWTGTEWVTVLNVDVATT